MDKKLTLRYLFEIIVIVFSVSLSFYIQEVLNDREKEELKNQSLNGVIEDLEIDKQFYTSAIDNLFGRIKACEDVLNGDINDEKINYLMSTWGFVGQDANYKSLISTGALEYIRSKNLHRELTIYYQNQYSILDDISNQYKKLYMEFLYFMKMNYPVESMIILNKETKTQYPIIPFNYSNKTLIKALNDDIFRNHIHEIKRMIYIYANFYQYTLKMQDKLHELIEEEINFN